MSHLMKYTYNNCEKMQMLYDNDDVAHKLVNNVNYHNIKYNHPNHENMINSTKEEDKIW